MEDFQIYFLLKNVSKSHKYSKRGETSIICIDLHYNLDKLFLFVLALSSLLICLRSLGGYAGKRGIIKDCCKAFRLEKRECSPISEKKIPSRKICHRIFFVTDYWFAQLIFESISKSIDLALRSFGAKDDHTSEER